MISYQLENWRASAPLSTESPEIWEALSAAINQLQGIVWDDPRIADEMARAEGVRYLTRLIAGAIPMTMEAWNPEYPSFFTFLSSRIQYGLPATDALYQWAPIHGDYVYRIKGRRGSAHMMDIETREGHFAHIGSWALCDRCSEFECDEDGNLEIVLSKTEQPGNWVKIPDGLGDLIFRQYFYDWVNEEPVQLQISRDGARYPAPPISPKLIAQRTQLLIDWLHNLPAFFAEQVKSYYQDAVNTLRIDEVSIGWAELRYGKACYECEPDEALIIEVVPPEAKYWSIQLYSQYWDARDWNLRQTSINGFQAVLSDDGVFRAVISHEDPGVVNWLDAANHRTGLLSLRYFRAKTAPVPTIRRVKLSELSSIITDPKLLISADQRSEVLRERAESVVRRACL
jgi:hypothetical protein